MWQEVALSCAEFMKEQSNPNNFEFYGFDVILDESRKCWLIEINRYEQFGIPAVILSSSLVKKLNFIQAAWT
jgi:hypothetical protein